MARRRDRSDDPGAFGRGREHPTEIANDEMGARPTIRANPPTRSLRTKIRAVLGRVIASPVFAYGLAALLAVPAGLFAVSKLQRASDSAIACATPAEAPPPLSSDPSAVAKRVMQRYETALRSRDVDQLRAVWDVGGIELDAIRELFDEARVIAPLIDVQEVTTTDDGPRRIYVEFAEVLTMLRGTGQVFARGPAFYTAEIVRGPGADGWFIQSRREVQSNPSERSGR